MSGGSLPLTFCILTHRTSIWQTLKLSGPPWHKDLTLCVRLFSFSFYLVWFLGVHRWLTFTSSVLKNLSKHTHIQLCKWWFNQEFITTYCVNKTLVVFQCLQMTEQINMIKHTEKVHGNKFCTFHIHKELIM